MTKTWLIGTTPVMLATLLAWSVPGIAQARSEQSRASDSQEKRLQSQERQSSPEYSQERSERSRGDKARFWEVSGEIDRAKKVRVLGSETDHLVALLHTDEGRWMAVDLGPTDTLRGIRIKTGDWIAAQGPIGTIGKRRVLMAHRVMTDDGRAIRVNRQRQRIAGAIEGLKTVKVRGAGTDSLLALIQTDDGRRVVVDLGNAKYIEGLQLKKGDHISVRGPSVQVKNRSVVMARQIQAEGEPKQITREYPSDEGATGTSASARMSEAVKPMLIEAIQHAREAEHAAREEQSDAVVTHAQRALKQIQEAQQSFKNERLHESAYALQDAIDHGKKGHAKDAADHIRHAIMRLSQAAGTQLPEGMKFARQGGPGHVSEEARPMVLEAIQHAIQAANAGQQGQPEPMTKHVRKAIGKAKEAQQAGHNERLNEGVFALGDAIEHAKQGHTNDATEHVSRAVAKLSQAVGQETGEGQRSAVDPAGGRQAGMETVQGEVVVKGEVLKIDRDGFYVVKDHSGQEVHLFVAEEMNRGLQVGDTISAQVKPDGTVSSIDKQDKQDGTGQQSQIEGQEQSGRSGESRRQSMSR